MDVLMSTVPWGSLGPTGLLALTVLGIIQGWIVPRKVLDDIIRDRDLWRQAAERKDETIRLLSEASTTTAAVIRSLPQDGGGADR